MYFLHFVTVRNCLPKLFNAVYKLVFGHRLYYSSNVVHAINFLLGLNPEILEGFSTAQSSKNSWAQFVLDHYLAWTNTGLHQISFALRNEWFLKDVHISFSIHCAFKYVKFHRSPLGDATLDVNLYWVFWPWFWMWLLSMLPVAESTMAFQLHTCLIGPNYIAKIIILVFQTPWQLQFVWLPNQLTICWTTVCPPKISTAAQNSAERQVYSISI
jgi:hypothetical protein